jgi:Cu-Zn family superoxide dismutase
MMNGRPLAILLAAAPVVLGACVGQGSGKSEGSGRSDAAADPPAATAELVPTSGNTVRGTVTFVQKGDMVVAQADISGLTPNSTHGFHIHENGDCSAADASSAGGHFDPSASPHGGPDGEVRHGGDLGNLKADENGHATGTVKVEGISIDSGPDRILGRAIVVHAGRDDLTSQPAGNSGARIACGVINPSLGKAG